MKETRTLVDLVPEDFPMLERETIRYADTDRQGHVNNAVFSTLLETGRVHTLYNRENPVLAPECSFVIANLNIDFRAELTWPGEAVIGTAVLRMGGSSVHLSQAIFQNGTMAASARSVIVQVKNGTSVPLSQRARDGLAPLRLPIDIDAE